MADNEGSDEIGVLIGPLRRGKSPDETAKCIFQLLNCVGIRCADISRISVNPAASFAKVELYKRECEDYAVKILCEGRSIMSLYDLRLLTDRPKYFTVERIVSRPHEAQQEHSALSDVMLRKEQQLAHFKATYTPLPEGGLAVRKLSGEHVMAHNARKDGDGEQVFDLISLSRTSSSTVSPMAFEKLEEEEDTESRSKSREAVHTATSMTGDLPHLGPSSKDVVMQLPSRERYSPKKKTTMVHADTSTTPLVEPCFCQGTTFYHRLQVLNTDAKNVYLDPGHVVSSDLRAFRTMIGQFVCASLNTDGGVLFFGVQESGEVHGIRVTQRYEDALRLDIDGQVKLIIPSVPTSAYKVNFAKVMDTTGHLLPDFKVLEVKVPPPVTPKINYTFRSATYVWKDGDILEINSVESR